MANNPPRLTNAFRPMAFVAAIAITLWPAGGRAQAPAPAGNDFEMPGVFRISLPQGWQKTKTIDDRLTVAVFSSKDLTLEVMRDLSRTPVEEYVKNVPDRRLRAQADDYPGAYSPLEVMSNPGAYTVEIGQHFDEYTSIGGLPALWVRNRLVYTKPPEENHAARVWSVVILNPGEYWSLELRGDDRSWPADDGELRRMVRSFQLLDPTLTHVKAAIPAEAWQHMPLRVPEGSCQFVGVASGIGTVVPCNWEVAERSQTDKGKADKDGFVGMERLTMGPSAQLYLYHFSGNWSAEEFLQNQESGLAVDLNAEKARGRSLSYKRNDKRDLSIDGASGAHIWATARDKKTRIETSLQLLTASSGTDHFSVLLSCGAQFAREHSGEIERLLSSIHLFPLRSEAALGGAAGSKSGDDAWGKMAAALSGLDDSLNIDVNSLLAGCKAQPDHPPAAAEVDRARENLRLFNNSNAHLRLAELLRASGDCDGESKELKAAVQANPRNGEANREIARVYMPITTQALAETMADRGSFPTFVPGEHNDLDRAIAAWERELAYGQKGIASAAADGDLASLYSLAGNTVFALFHKESSGDDATKVHRSPSEIAAATKEYEKRTTEAQAAAKALKDDPSLKNRLRLAEQVMAYGDFVGAGVQCGLMHRIDPHDLRALACLARVSDVRGEREALIGFVNEWLALSPNAPEAYFWQARAYQWEPADLKKEAESYRAVVENSGKAQIAASMLQEARVYWPLSYENAEMWQDAANAYEACVHDSPNDAGALNGAAWFFATTQSKLRNPAKALEYATRAAAAAPKDGNIMDTLAEAYFINGRIDQAVTTEQKAVALAPGNEELKKQLKRFKDVLQARQPKKIPATRAK